MVQVISFTDYSQCVDEKVNEWIKKHKNVKILDIKYNTCVSNAGTLRESMLIIYDDEPEKKTDNIEI